MKKRRNVIISLLLVAALALGIGYAAIADVLEINGNADISKDGAQTEFDQDVCFTDAVANVDGDVASIIDGDDDTASFTAFSLKAKGDIATFTFTITHKADDVADLAAIVTPTLASDGNNHPEYFKISSDWAGQPKTIQPGKSETYTVTVELLKTPDDVDVVHGVFHIELNVSSTTATPSDAQG